MPRGFKRSGGLAFRDDTPEIHIGRVGGAVQRGK
jgi:hypothetical protein